MRISLLAAGTAALVFVASLGFAQPPVREAPRVPMPVTNLQVLPRDIPHERLMGIMQGFTRSLGVQCGFCHVRGNFASDSNPHKNVARGMMRMTMRINGELLPPIVGPGEAPRVTCYTCHRGAAEPATAAPAPDLHVAPGAPSQPH